MTIHALVPQCAEPRKRCFELFECIIAKIFLRLVCGSHLGGLAVPLLDSPAALRFFSLLRLSKNRYPKKIAGYGTT